MNDNYILNIIRKKEQNTKEHIDFIKNLHCLLDGDKKLASKPLLIGSIPNILLLCCKRININIEDNSKLYINKKTIEKVMRPEERDIKGQRTIYYCYNCIKQNRCNRKNKFCNQLIRERES